jgi:HpcH/HpaI aldolase/citrate lyase family
VGAGNSLQLILITNDPTFGRAACAAGVNRILIDLETLGKRERQRGKDTLISYHLLEDISRVRPFVPADGLMTRINPLHPNSRHEIDTAIAHGTDFLMLPMFRSVQEVREFIQMVDGRCKTTLLLETTEARRCLDDIVQLSGIDEIHLGLNDLSIELGVTFMFQVLAEGIVDEVATKVCGAGIRFGFGGVGLMGGGPLPGEVIIAEHKRIGSEMVILSRSFYGNSKTLSDLERKGLNLRNEIAKLRGVEHRAMSRSQDQIEADRSTCQRLVSEIVQQLASAQA